MAYLIHLLFVCFLFIISIVHMNGQQLEKEFYDLEEAEEIFQKYVKDFDKKYESDEEYAYRFLVFKDNLEEINKLNEASPNVAYKINSFTDLTAEEFKKQHTGLRRNKYKGRTVDFKSKLCGRKSPEYLDLREQGLVTKVKNQRHCGACYSFSAIGSIEGQYARKYGQLISLSEQQGLDCQENACDGGYVEDVVESLAKLGGAMREKDYPYRAMKLYCRSNPAKIAVKVIGGYQLRVRDEEELKTALLEYGPLSIAIYVSQYISSHYNTGIVNATRCPSWLPDHAALLIGYGTENGTDYWLIKNSWGTIWGEEGYLRIERGRRACNIGSYVYTTEVA